MMADDDIRTTVTETRCVHCGLSITFDRDSVRWVDASGFTDCTLVFDGHRP
jgi:hypothetical protein